LSQALKKSTNYSIILLRLSVRTTKKNLNLRLRMPPKKKPTKQNTKPKELSASYQKTQETLEKQAS